MTSKEVQKMIIDVENDIERFGGMIQFYYQLNILRSYKQDLERLEMLEKANNKIVDEFLELHYYNQKVLKTISILKNRFNLEIKHYANQEGGYIAFIQEYLVDNDLNQQEYELLKEVLEDE